MTTIGADDKVGADREFTFGRLRANADDAAALLDQVGSLGAHAQIEGLVALAAGGEKIEKIPLRHQRDVFAMGRQVGQIDHANAFVADLRGQMVDLLMRQFQKIIEQTKLVHQFESRRMNGIAAKVAEKIGMLLQHDNIDAGARQQKAEHHPGRATAGDAALGGNRRVRHNETPHCGRRRGKIAPAVKAGCGVFCGATPSFFCRLVDDVVYWNTNRFSG